ncbi:hypothetical protein HYPSUDRAFT_135353 [Hypholoma sublateritium FD-334 SS-4]|uniref:CxC2-like cysteine cluster KDZ transposase-associated domain-containing protein n=1 Tax=Hypholoma sublateritium (strain FD-334 SS-4) TaxID=945553 RepID=A0A0D2LD02_HYPSF|nr:hypothetical protein HYPSUDRAFT_135353 [Hypholoma sublateritium FD-334 SS-4]
MSAPRSRRNREQVGGSYHDRIPLEHDFKTVQARTASVTSRGTAVDLDISSLPSPWTVGSSWAPEESYEFSLDPDDGWYDEAIEANIEDVMEEYVVPKVKKRRTHVSVRFQCVSVTGNKEHINPPQFRCRDCFLPDLTCQVCCIRRHRLNPFHNIERWGGSHFVKTTLKDIGLVLHLNHGSMRCPMPSACDERLRIVHTTGVHEVALSYCGCNREIARDLQLLRRGLYPASQQKVRTCVTFPLLKLLHLLSLMGKVSTFDMYHSIERLTNNTGMNMPRSRYRPTMRCLNQWRHLKALKRGGRGHDTTGAAGTSDGELALLCPTCPHPGINLPTNWADAPKEKQFLYMSLICMDANFRLKNHLVSNFSADPGLWDGMAYMTSRLPYEEYVLSQADAEDISTCVGFQALAKATTQNTRGLRYTGVSGAMCGRSEMVLPNSIGNLQKGERYANMDYVFASAIKSTKLLLVAISYDIVCQWFVNIFKRMSAWPVELQPRAGLNLRPLIPKFHEPAHLEKLHEQYSFNLAEGVGLSDGECPERVWGSHNPLAGATRTMGPGTRDDMLDDNFGHWNWMKYSSIGVNQQLEAHRGFTKSLPPNVVAGWDLMCVEWDADGFPKSTPNPFKTPETNTSEDEVQDQLDKEEAAALRAAGRIPLHKTSASSFVSMGLELEESRDKVKNWESVRAVYMPGLLQIQTDAGLNPTAIWDSNPNPEDVQLWLPSEIAPSQRHAACVEGLPEIELQLRTAQCDSSLEGLRQALRVKTRMVYFKNKNIRGQREGTRSRSIIDRVHKRAIHFVQKYRAARHAKLRLEGPGSWEKMYRELRNEDIRGFASGKPKKKPPRRGIWEDGHAPPEPKTSEIFDEAEEESDPDLDDPTERGLPPRKKRKKGTGETRKELSWIWQTLPLNLNAEEDDVILRAEWARSRARVRCASEEVMLLREEMRRALKFLKWRALWWEDKQDVRSDMPAELKEGICAYASRQASIQRELATFFKELWKTPLAHVCDLLMGLETTEYSNDEPDNEHENDDSETEDMTDL